MPVQGVAAFEKRVAAHRDARQNDPADNSSLLEVLTPEASAGGDYPLIVLLHGNGSTAQQEINRWQPAVEMGWIVAAPQSETVFWAGGGGFWASHEAAQTQLAGHLEQLRQDYAIDETRIVFAGFSMGGDVAAAQTLKGILAKPLGFIVVGPGGPMMDDPESFRSLLHASRDQISRCIFFVSDADPYIQPDKIKMAADMCREYGFEIHYEVYSDPGHVYPADFEVRLRQVLSKFR